MLALSLLFLAVGLAVISLVAWVVLKIKQQTLGSLTHQVVAMDTHLKPGEKLYSTTLPLVGKPDYIVEKAGFLIPVELKNSTTPNQPYFNHIMQLTAYCVLINDTYHQRPPYGIIKYADKEFTVPFTEHNEQMLHNIVTKMHKYKTGQHEFYPDQNKKWLCQKCTQKLSELH